MVASVQKAMKILLILSNAKNHPVALMDISAQTGYPKPTCSHLLKSLCQDGYVLRVSHSEGYVLGPKIYYLVRYGQYEEEMVTICRPIMRWMERKSNATVVLSVIHGNQKFIIDYVDRMQNLFLEHPQIRTDDIYRTATGRAILSHMNRNEIKSIWEKYGAPPPGHWDEITSYESFINELEKIRRQDIVITGASEKNGEQNAIGYAHPLFRNGICVGAVGIALKPSSEDQSIDITTEEMLLNILRKGAREISRRLSYED